MTSMSFANVRQKHLISKSCNHFIISVQCHEFVQVMKHSVLCPLPAGSAIVRDLRLWHGGTPQWIKFHETLGSISTCSWSVGLQRSLHCFKIFKLLVHLRSPEWHSTLPNPAMNCIAWFIVFRSGCISARALQGYLPNAEFVSLTWGSLTHLGCRMSHWRLKTRLCFYWYWAYRFGLLPHMLAILLYNILHNVQR